MTAYWFVGASYGPRDDQTPRFVDEGIWENGYQDRYLDEVKAMRPGDRIAIKAAYTRKHGLDFNRRGHTVSVMAIKAIGTVLENPGDGRHVKVDWQRLETPREWFFYTNRGTVWRVRPGDWMADGLIAFAFHAVPQDVNRFCNDPFWRERFGTAAEERVRFAWTTFYEAVADKLLGYRNDRPSLIAGLRDIAERIDGLGYLSGDQYPDGSNGFVRDICPFTVMGMFNRGITDANRRTVALELVAFLGVEVPVPETFEGIPVLNNLKSWFFPYERARDVDHIQSLWDVLAAAVRWADDDSDETEFEFARAFDAANGRKGVAWNLTAGLYWARPWAFLSLDERSRSYLSDRLSITLGRHGPKGRCSAQDYLAVMATLESNFREASYPVHSYPDLSLSAWQFQPNGGSAAEVVDENASDSGADEAADAVVPPLVRRPQIPYSIDDVIREGAFIDRSDLERLLDRLRIKKNLILQGPPGTGKTWLAKRLAFALMGERDAGQLRAVQFHPGLSYEDFVRGWRPSAEGGLKLTEGVFMQAIHAALSDPSRPFVVVIEEINRGNPAQVFGELLTLLEAGKRTPSEALELSYPDPDGKRRPVHVPENLYVIGTMNVADRSLALVDLALRRRFAFVDLEPKFGPQWRSWVQEMAGLKLAEASEIELRLTALNDRITADARLGKQFRVGHSYVTPPTRLESGEAREWFRQVVLTEIGPLLEEYWFDAPDEARAATDALLRGW